MELSESLQTALPMLLGIAWLLPLASFALIVLFGPRMGKHGVLAGYVATGAIVGSFVLSAAALVLWLGERGPTGNVSHAAEAHGAEAHGAEVQGEHQRGAAKHGEAKHAEAHADSAESSAHHAAAPVYA